MAARAQCLHYYERSAFNEPTSEKIGSSLLCSCPSVVPARHFAGHLGRRGRSGELRNRTAIDAGIDGLDLPRLNHGWSLSCKEKANWSSG
jgi:hypothetical protein